jgi:hypothetical protein
MNLEAIVTYDLVRKAIGQGLHSEMAAFVNEWYWRGRCGLWVGYAWHRRF